MFHFSRFIIFIVYKIFILFLYFQGEHIKDDVIRYMQAAMVDFNNALLRIEKQDAITHQLSHNSQNRQQDLLIMKQQILGVYGSGAGDAQ